MSWIVDDSEDEGDFAIPPNPLHETLSTISEFSAREIILPTTENVSSISEFTTDNTTMVADTSIDTIIVPSTSAVKPEKPKRPKPRPAYRAYKEAMASANHNTSAASVIASAISRTNQGPLQAPAPLTDMSFNLDIAERTKMRKRSATGNQTNGSDPVRSSNSSKQASTIIEGSSRDVIVLYSSDTEGDRRGVREGAKQRPQGPHSNAKITAALCDSKSSLPPPSPPSSVPSAKRASFPLHDLGLGRQSTPPSSPFQPRRRKRKSHEEDFDFMEESIDVGNDKGSPSISAIILEPEAKKQKRSKEKKTRGKGAKETTEGDTTIHTRSPTTKSKKRQSKAREKVLEPEFKSKEFVEDSDDDPLLLPGPSKSASRPTRSDLAAAEVSVDASLDVSVQPSVFLPIEATMDPAPALPSVSVPNGPSAAFSELPLADISAPPPSPSLLPQASRSSKPKLEKRKKQATAIADCTSTSIDKCDASDCGPMNTALVDSNGSCGASVQPEKEVKKARQSRKAKGWNDTTVSPNDGGKLAGSSSAQNPSPDSTGQDNSERGKSRSREKDRKKARMVVSPDEDSDGIVPEAVSSKDKPLGMEVAGTEARVRSVADKENRSTSPSNDQPEKTSAPSSTISAPTRAIQARPSEPKPRVATPKMPSRRDSMSALIRRVSSKVQSPLGTPSPVYCHSPLAKASRAVLSRIAPLHPNRRSPPPPPPRPPAPKKTKKMLELEEKWEMELAESVDGWSCMTDEERAALRRAKRDAELGYDD